MTKKSSSTPLKFPVRLRRARIEHGLSQQDLAEAVNVSHTDIESWEAGKTTPHMALFLDLEAILGPLAEPTGPRDEDGAAQNWSAGAFGAWLKRAREKRKLSVPALAARANVTTATIYNLESGRNTNPQETTRKRLEKALGKVTPVEIVDEAEREQEVEGLGALTDFDPHAPDDLPPYGGVYVLYDICRRPVYVGQGQIIKKRISAHAKKFWFQRPIVETAAFIRIEENQLRRQVEQILIRFLKSNALINKQHVER